MGKQERIQNRMISTVAREIRADWPKIGVAPWSMLECMLDMCMIEEMYMSESNEGIVRRFLSGAGGWRGENAKRIKAELWAMCGGKGR